MRRHSSPLATLIAAMLASSASGCHAVASSSGAEPADAQRPVADHAIDALAADLKVPKESITVESVTAIDWRDSSLGCPKPGMAYLDVITPGHKVTLQVDRQIYVVHEAKNHAFVCQQTNARDGITPDVMPNCDCLRVLKIRTVERAEATLGRPVPPSKEGESRPVDATSSAIFYLSLECEGQRYVARVLASTRGFKPDEVAAAGSLYPRRAETGKVFLKTEAGFEFEAIVAIADSPTISPPR